MTAVNLLSRTEFYGAFELKKFYGRNYSVGISLAILFHLAIVICFGYFSGKQELIIQNIKPGNYDTLKNPPIWIDTRVNVPISTTTIKPKDGILIPVPNDLADKNAGIATQVEISRTKSNNIDDTPTSVVINQPGEKIEIKEKEPSPGEFIPVEQQPEIIYAAIAVYPELAIKAGITGKVYVNVLIDKEGKPKRAIVYKSDSDLFNQAAIDAAMKSAFKPALQNKQPVSVWLVIPYRFTLEGQQ